MAYCLEYYSVAIRKRTKQIFWEERGYQFEEIIFPFSDRYWAADPFVFEHDNTVYLFYEYFDTVLCKGTIAYSTLDGNRASDPIVILNMPYHLSYPNVFTYNGNIYMIPETGEVNQVQLYVATQFPNQWRLERVLIDNIKACDTCVCQKNGGLYLMPSEMDKELSSEYWCYVRNKLYFWDEKKEVLCIESNLKEGDFGVRNGGNFCNLNGKSIRIGQDCTDGKYGKGLVFWEMSAEMRDEVMIKHILPENIEKHIIWHSKKHHPLKGIHTYNMSEHYEVIDCSENRKKSVIVKWKNKIHRFVYRMIQRRL